MHVVHRGLLSCRRRRSAAFVRSAPLLSAGRASRRTGRLVPTVGAAGLATRPPRPHWRVSRSCQRPGDGTPWASGLWPALPDDTARGDGCTTGWLAGEQLLTAGCMEARQMEVRARARLRSVMDSAISLPVHGRHHPPDPRFHDQPPRRPHRHRSHAPPRRRHYQRHPAPPRRGFAYLTSRCPATPSRRPTTAWQHGACATRTTCARCCPH